VTTRARTTAEGLAVTRVPEVDWTSLVLVPEVAAACVPARVSPGAGR
jgi:hypothetical protein